MTPREIVYEQGRAILTVGVDELGRVYSKIIKGGKVVIRDIFVRMPTEAELAKQGWVKKQYE